MKFKLTALIAAACLVAGAAYATEIVFADPKGDDDGPGGYTYPTDAVFKKGSFDIERLTVSPEESKVGFEVKVNSRLEDPWRTGAGFSLQMALIFIDTDNVPGSGHTEGLPGLNVSFDRTHAWDKVIILSPQSASRIQSEIDSKTQALAGDILFGRTKGSGQVIQTSIDLDALGGGDPAKWSYQVVMQSNEGFPSGRDLLTRRVNEEAGSQKFGGGTDADCDPNVMDVLAGNAEGDVSEITAQHAMLAYQCSEDGETVKPAVLQMVRR